MRSYADLWEVGRGYSTEFSVAMKVEKLIVLKSTYIRTVQGWQQP